MDENGIQPKSVETSTFRRPKWVIIVSLLLAVGAELNIANAKTLLPKVRFGLMVADVVLRARELLSGFCCWWELASVQKSPMHEDEERLNGWRPANQQSKMQARHNLDQLNVHHRQRSD